MKLQKIIIAIAALALLPAAQASSRIKNKLGLSYGILSEPAPSISAFQVKYNLTPWLQIYGGYGKVGTTVKTYGGGAKIFLLPSWNFSPFVGGGFGYSKLSGDFTLSGSTVNSGTDSMKTYYGSVGLDHQANIGFNFGAGINYFFAPTELKSAIKYLPGFYLGWVF